MCRPAPGQHIVFLPQQWKFLRVNFNELYDIIELVFLNYV